MKYLLIVLSLSFFSLKQTTIESQFASFDGKKMILDGSVFLTHEMGSIFADSAQLHKRNNEKDFDILEVQGDVRFRPSFGGEITADTLQLFVLEKKALLTSSTKKQFVSFKGQFSGHPLSFKSPQILFLFSDDNKTRPIEVLKEIHAEDPVKTTWAKHIKLYSQQASFFENTQKFHFACLNSEDNCVLFYADKAEVNCKTVEIEPSKNIVQGHNAKGEIFLNQGLNLSFIGNLLIFESDKDLLKLSENVSLSCGDFICKNDKEVIVFFDKETNEPIKRIHIPGQTIIYDEKDTQFYCNGEVWIDQFQKKIVLQGKIDPLLFDCRLGKVRASKAIIDFDTCENKPVVTKIYFEGNVACLNDAALFKDDSENQKRMALADFVTYIPKTNELSLKSKKNSRVLFYDEIKKTKFSAEQILIDLPAGEKKERIQTQGNVRMVFSQKEDIEFKKYFSFEDE
jgi:hypothetical protein